MLEYIFLAVGFLLLSGAASGLMDGISFHPQDYNVEWDEFWDPQISWKNKYVNRDEEQGRIKWLWNTVNKPVFLTDGWHLLKSIQINCMSFSMTCLFSSSYDEISWKLFILAFLIISLIFRAGFKIMYK